ncbi:hypothetical protein Tco_1247811 [Tanacetum coccineum]
MSPPTIKGRRWWRYCARVVEVVGSVVSGGGGGGGFCGEGGGFCRGSDGCGGCGVAAVVYLFITFLTQSSGPDPLFDIVSIPGDILR